MSRAVRRKNPNSTSDLIEFAKKLEKKAVYIGLPAGTAGDLAMIGAVHQFGSETRGIPARPWLDKGVEAGADRYQAIAKKSVTRVLTGKLSVPSYYRILGEAGSASVKNYIRTATFVPLSPYTIKKKKSSKPLIDTGQMRNSVTYEVRND